MSLFAIVKELRKYVNRPFQYSIGAMITLGVLFYGNIWKSTNSARDKQNPGRLLQSWCLTLIQLPTFCQKCSFFLQISYGTGYPDVIFSVRSYLTTLNTNVLIHTTSYIPFLFPFSIQHLFNAINILLIGLLYYCFLFLNKFHEGRDFHFME